MEASSITTTTAAVVAAVEENSRFDFFSLPLLVQSKIFRDYLPAFFKSGTLSRMEEMQDLVEDFASWSDCKDPCLHPLLQLVDQIVPGYYLSKKSWWKDGFLVQVEQDNNLMRFTHFHFAGKYPDVQGRRSSKIREMEPLNIGVQFLKSFLKKYEWYHPEEVVVHRQGDLGDYVINHQKKTVYWIDGCEYMAAGGPLLLFVPEEGEDEEDDPYVDDEGIGRNMHVIMRMDEEDPVHEIVYNHFPEDGSKRRKCVIPLPKPTKSCLGHWLSSGRIGSIHNLKSAFMLEIRFLEGTGRVSIEIDRLYKRSIWRLFRGWDFTKKMRNKQQQ